MTSETAPVHATTSAAESPSATTEETNAGVARATGVVALGNITSRVLGLAREIVLTNLFGASRAVDAFNVAIIVPRAIYDLLIGGHVNSALVPVLSEVAVREGRKALWELVSILCTLVTIILAVMVLLLYIFAPQVVRLVSSGFDPVTLGLAEAQLRLTAPALIFMGLFAVLSGTLYALKEFTWPAFAVTVFNGSVVIIGLTLAPALRLVPNIAPNGMLELLYTRPDSGIIAVTLGWLVGSIAQMLLQLPGMKGARVRPRFNWRHPAVRRVAALYAPVMFSLIIDALVIRTFSYNLASQLQSRQQDRRGQHRLHELGDYPDSVSAGAGCHSHQHCHLADFSAAVSPDCHRRGTPLQGYTGAGLAVSNYPDPVSNYPDLTCGCRSICDGAADCGAALSTWCLQSGGYPYHRAGIASLPHWPTLCRSRSAPDLCVLRSPGYAHSSVGWNIQPDGIYGDSGTPLPPLWTIQPDDRR